MGSAEVSGMDFAARYSPDVAFGSIYSILNGTYRLDHKESAKAVSVAADRLPLWPWRFRGV
jgi:hypothetical protein